MCAKRRSSAKTPNNPPEKLTPAHRQNASGLKMKTVELQFAIFSLRMERHTEMNWASVTNFAPTIQGIIQHFVVAGGIFAMEPHAARMSRVRAAEKDAQRRAQREASITAARLDDGPVTIRFPREITERRRIDPVSRAHRREERLTGQRLEADRVASALAVKTAAEVFIRAIRHSTAMLAAMEEDGLDPQWFTGPLLFATPLPEAIPGVDINGRALVVYMRDNAAVWQYERRTRALARLTSVERSALLEAVLSHPDASQDAVRKAREMFARVMENARARDAAAAVARCAGDACILPTRETHND
jgi:hypothetical protein